jgi:small-conductance mechanosensitive channel
MQAILSFFTDVRDSVSASSTLSQLFATVVVLVAAMMVTRSAAKYYRGKDSGSTGERRTAYTAVRNGVAVVVLILLLFLWGGQLRHFALSVAALAAAVAIASKEFVMSALGSLMRATQRPYAVGDIIEINGMKGEVLIIDLFSTTLLEEAQSGYVTGRTYQFPNMLLLLNPVRKSSTMGSFVLEAVRVPLDPADDVVAAENRLLQSAVVVCEPWVQQADAHFRRIEGAYLVALPESRPVALIEPVDAKRVDVVVRFPCPSNRRMAVGQQILNGYYSMIREDKKARAATHAASAAAKAAAPAAGTAPAPAPATGAALPGAASVMPSPATTYTAPQTPPDRPVPLRPIDPV